MFNARNPGAADRFFAPEFVDHSLPPAMPATLEGFRQWLAAFQAAFPDARWETEVIFGRGDLVAWSKRFRGTHRGEYFGLAPTGRPAEASETGIARFQNGRIVEFWGVLDDAKLMRELS